MSSFAAYVGIRVSVTMCVCHTGLDFVYWDEICLQLNSICRTLKIFLCCQIKDSLDRNFGWISSSRKVREEGKE